MKKTTIKSRVTKIEQISPNVKRIRLHNRNMLEFVNDEVGGYIKLIFEKKDTGVQLVRPYTIRNFYKKKNEIDIDFSIHGKVRSYASKWASNVKLNDEILISGPGQKKFINLNSDWFFFIGDMSSLPAINTNIEKLVSDSKGHVVIEIYSDKDKQIVKKPMNIKYHWVINKNPGKNSNKLINKVKAIKWLNSNLSLWVACEFGTMKILRNFFIKEKKIDKDKIYISSYWKIDSDQEEHKILKKKDSSSWIKN